ncbi:Glyoxalase I [Psidium guajava]|nr:Glyoxalase I [Psidium guajava]
MHRPRRSSSLVPNVPRVAVHGNLHATDHEGACHSRPSRCRVRKSPSFGGRIAKRKLVCIVVGGIL